MAIRAFKQITMSHNGNKSTQANRALAKLWSSIEDEREEGKRELVHLGFHAIDPLLALLDDLMRNRHPRFPTGREREGNEVVNRIKSSFQTKPIEEAWDKARRDREQLHDLQINARLVADVIELLGYLKAEKAVPLLIKVLESDRPRGAWESMYPEMEALCRIGAPAVPGLIEAIENVNVRVSAADWYPSGSVLDLDARGSEELAIESHPDADADFQKEDEDAERRYSTRRIVARAVKVLGEIGDARALPVLEKILHSNDVELVRVYAEPAINKIKSG